MRKRLTMTLAAGVLGGALLLTGCSSGDQDPSKAGPHHGGSSSTSSPASSDGGMDHSSMEHPMDGGPAPAGIKTAAAPTVIYEDLSLAMRTLRDVVNPRIEKIRIDSRENFQKITSFVEELMPEISDRTSGLPSAVPSPRCIRPAK